MECMAGTRVRDMVYVDGVSGNIVAVHPQIHGTSLPSTLRKSKASTRKPIQRSNCVERKKLLQ